VDPVNGLILSAFSARRPAYEFDQTRALEWLVDAHTRSQATLEGLSGVAAERCRENMRRRIARFACGPTKIASRGTVVADFGSTRWRDHAIYALAEHPHGRGIGARSALFDAAVAGYFELEYEGEPAPADLVHVTCTGYISPSGAQRLVARRGWGATTRVTHAYHMGCYAAFPALRIAAGHLGSPPPAGNPRVDIVHTELCSLHLDPSDHSAEQLVVQSLFADGFIRYAVRRRLAPRERGLRVLALDEQMLPDSADAMRWIVSDHGMHMTLAADVPDRIAGALRGFVAGLFTRAGMTFGRERPLYAIHPGGPKIIDGVRDTLELSDVEVEASRGVLLDYGNMSSATLPHIWMRLCADPRVAPGTLVVSLAFGPGLTISGGLLRVE
jgi:predicted naringenin-chalcone synthase